MDYRIPDDFKALPRMKNTRITIRGGNYYLDANADIYYEGSDSVRFKKYAVLGKFCRRDGEAVIVYNDGYLGRESVSVLGFGGYSLLRKLTPHIETRLLSVFGQSDAYHLYVLAILTCLYPRTVRVGGFKYYFGHSFASQDYPFLRLSENTVSRFLGKIGSCAEPIREYQEKRPADGSGEYFTDGTLIRNGSDSGLAARGRAGEAADRPVINVIHIYDARMRVPVFYKEFKGGTSGTSPPSGPRSPNPA
jgi:hypothetical protein